MPKHCFSLLLTLFFCLCHIPLQAALIPEAEYRMDECSWSGLAGEVVDSTGNSHDASANNSATPSNANQLICSAANLTGTRNLQVDTPFATGNSWSVATWVLFPLSSSGHNPVGGFGNVYVLGSVAGTGDLGLIYDSFGTNLRWLVYDNNGRTSNANFPDNLIGWHHITLVGSGGSTSLFLDGALLNTISRKTTGDFQYIGTSHDDPTGQTIGALIDEYKVFTNALTPAEINTMYTNELAGNNFDGTARSCPICPVAIYRFDECTWDGTAGEVEDLGGNGLHGTSQNGAQTTDISVENGGICLAAELDGVDQYVQVDDTDNSLDLASALTVMAWVKPASLPAVGGLKTIISKDENYEFHVDSSGQIFWWWQDSGGGIHMFTSTTTLTPGQWYHVAIRYSNGSQSIYINGQERGTASVSGTLLVNNDPLQVGSDQNFAGRYFEGNIDEVMIFNSSLSPADILNIYNYQLAKNNYDNSSRTCPDCIPTSRNFVFSTLNTATLAGLSFEEDDLIYYDSLAGTAAQIFSGNTSFSNPNENIDAVHYLDSGQIIISTVGDASIGGINFGDDDLVQYDPLTGTTTLLFNGGNLFLSANEDIDAVHILANGHIALSTTGGATLGGLSFGDDDIIEYDPVSDTATVLFDGGTLFSNPNEDVDAVYITATGNIILSTTSFANLGGVTFANEDLVEYNPFTGATTLIFDGSANFAGDENIDAISVQDLNLGQLDHYEILHDGQASTCAPEPITIRACADAACTTLYNGTTSVTLSPSGWVGGDSKIFTGGSGTFQLANAVAGPVTLGIISASPPAQNPNKCFIGTIEDCTLTFSGGTGLVFDVPTLTACATSTPITMSAVNASCNAVLRNRTRRINFWSTYINPATGTRPVSINGIPISGSPPGTPIRLSFNNAGQTTFTLNYADAGQLQLNADFLSLTGSDTFVVAPHSFALAATTDSGATPLTNTTATGDPKVKTGTAFQLTITAQCQDGTPTPNFAWDTNLSAVAPSNPAPVIGGTLGALTINSGTATITAATYGGGIATTAQLEYSEVGNITIQSQALNYLGATDADVSGVSGLVGRFTPNHFQISNTNHSLTPGCANAKPNDSFSYIGQTLGYSAPPDITITAKNAFGNTTQNYFNFTSAGGLNWWQLNDIAITYTDANMSGGITLNAGAATASMNSDSPTGNGTFTTTLGGTFTYTRNAIESAPFDSALTLSFNVQDNGGIFFDAEPDGTSNNPFSLTLDFDGNNIRQLSGIIDIAEGFGPETENIENAPFNAFYYDGTNWKPNTDDNCTTGSELTFCSSPAGRSILTQPIGAATLLAGRGQFTVTTSATPDEIVTVCPTAPGWLTSLADCSAPDTTFCGDFTFGIYRGNDRIINWREIVR